MNVLRARISVDTVVVSMALCVFATGYAGAQVQYVEEGAASGIVAYTMQPGLGGGVAAADFDDDGDVDLFLPNAAGVPDQLYRNLGDGRFEEIGEEAGVASLKAGRTALWFDYDGDHRLDLLVGGDCFEQTGPCTEPATLTLYRQVSPGSFSDVTAASGIAEGPVIFDESANRSGMAAGDINDDGYLDVVIGMWKGKSRLLLNNTDGTFTDISSAIGIGGSQVFHWQHVMHDFNRDGLLDIFTSYDTRRNQLWINQGGNSFVDEAESAQVDNIMSDMGITLGDYDNDGDFDIYVTNIEFMSGLTRNVLHRNDSSGETLIFEEISRDAGVATVGWAWGCTFFDANNDGLLDLAVTNGHAQVPYDTDASAFFFNEGGDPITFSLRSSAVGFDDTLMGSSLIAIDYNRDGVLDLAQTIQPGGVDASQVSLLRLLRSEPGPEAAANRFLVIKPRIPGPNHRGIGAVVRAQAGGLSMARLISAGTSFLGQEPAEAHFGLGDALTADVTVEWPDGSESAFVNLEANHVYVVDKDAAYLTDADSDGDGLFDYDEVSLYGTQPAEPDTDGDGVSDGDEVVFGSDPLDPGDTVALGALGPLALVGLIMGLAVLGATRRVGRRWGV